jgi:hypothetical protein
MSSQPLNPLAGVYFGKYRGKVEDNVDPTRRGRLKVTVPAVLGEAAVWALPCVPYAGKDMGFYMMPEKDTPVWVEFEAGDPSFPIWTGCFWVNGDIAEADAQPTIKFIRTKKFKLRIDDSVGEVVIENDGGSVLKITALEIEQKSSTVRAVASGGKKTELGAVGFNVNDGGLEVL